MLAAILRPNLSSNDRKNVGIRSVFNSLHVGLRPDSPEPYFKELK